MHRSIILSSLVPSIIAAATLPVRADRGAEAMPAIRGGLELGVAVSAARTAGDLGGAMDAGDVIGSAAELELTVGRRVTPHLALSFYASAQSEGDSSTAGRDVRTGSAGVVADLHLRPARATDPWLRLGGGVRALMTLDDGTSLLVGAELARVQLGVDLRVTEDVALAPFLGASASLYGAGMTPADDFSELDDKGITWTLTAGIGARFDAFGVRR